MKAYVCCMNALLLHSFYQCHECYYAGIDKTNIDFY